MTRWIYSGGEPLIDLLSVLAVVAFAALAMGGALVGLAHLIRRTDPPDEPESGPDDRGGGSPRPDPPRPRPAGDPAWWPEFERDFAKYVSVRAAESGTANSPTNACAHDDQAWTPSRAPRRRTGDRRASRSRRRRRRERTDACVSKRPR
jgi:hypothetical protein